MRFLSNTYNPDLPDARRYVSRNSDETQDQAWEHHRQWLKGKIIGKPQATASKTVEELEAIDMVGVYSVN